jgi:hypothetical protein
MHPIWRGIGFLMLILIPIIAFFLTSLILEYFASDPLSQPAYFLRSLSDQNYLYLQIGLTVFLTVLIYLIFNILGALIYSMFGGHEDEELVSRIGSQRRRY